jgi:hypothetical protein
LAGRDGIGVTGFPFRSTSQLLAHLRVARLPALKHQSSPVTKALFHLLIDEAVGNWSVARQRGVLALAFDHGKMKSVCEAFVTSFYI